MDLWLQQQHSILRLRLTARLSGIRERDDQTRVLGEEEEQSATSLKMQASQIPEVYGLYLLLSKVGVLLC